jgi:hypothetical protein
MQDDEAGPSGYQQEDLDMKNADERSKNKKKKKKNKRQNTERPRASSFSTGYRMPWSTKETQKSHSIRKIVPPRLFSSIETETPQKRYVVHQPESSSSERDHHEAVDFYYRSTLYSHHLESLSKLKISLLGRNRSDERRERISTLSLPPPQQPPFKTVRCRSCLNTHASSLCESDFDERTSTDFVKYMQPNYYDRKNSVESRLKWLTDMEESNKINKQKFLDDEIEEKSALCCFPFKKYALISKREKKYMRFYLNN